MREDRQYGAAFRERGRGTSHPWGAPFRRRGLIGLCVWNRNSTARSVIVLSPTFRRSRSARSAGARAREAVDAMNATTDALATSIPETNRDNPGTFRRETVVPGLCATLRTAVLLAR